MKYTVLTLFPQILQGYLGASILARAIADGKVCADLVNIREFAADKHRTCDDYSYGGGPGMVLKAEPIMRALDHVEASGKRVICPTPGGRLLDQDYVRELSRERELVIVCGRYEGIDQRVLDACITDEISIGDYILAGGESAAIVIIDAVSRIIGGVIRGESLDEESFEGGLLEYPQYTRPEEYCGMSVPEVLLSGHHEEIRKWRLEKSVEKTMKHRPDLLTARKPAPEVEEILRRLKRREEYGNNTGY